MLGETLANGQHAIDNDCVDALFDLALFWGETKSAQVA